MSGNQGHARQILTLSEIAEIKARYDRTTPTRTSGRLLLSIDQLWKAREARVKEPKDFSPRYLGRSGSSR